MKVEIELVDDIVVLEPCGGMWDGWETSPCRREIDARLEAGHLRFLVDLSRSRLVNLAGIGALVALLGAIRERQGELKLCGLGDRAHRAFSVTGLDRVFETYPGREEALLAFGVTDRRAG